MSRKIIKFACTVAASLILYWIRSHYGWTPALAALGCSALSLIAMVYS